MPMTPAEAEAQIRSIATELQATRARNDDLQAKVEQVQADATEALSDMRAAVTEAQKVRGGSDDVTVRSYTVSEGVRQAVGQLYGQRADLDFAGAVHLRGYQDPDTTQMHWGLLDDPTPQSEWQERAQTEYDEWAMARYAARAVGAHVISKVDAHYRRRMNRTLSRVFTDSTALGGEFIPEQTLASVEREARDAGFGRVAGLFRRIPLNGADVKLPFATNGLQPFIQDAISSDDPARYQASSIATASRSIAPSNWAILAVISRNASADSIIATMPLLRSMFVEAIVDAEEDAIINADDDGTHYHTGLVGMTFGGRWTTRAGSADHGNSWKGLMREAAAASATVDLGSAQTAAGVITLQKTLGNRFSASSGVAFIASIPYWLTMMGFDEVETVDKSGPAASILRGAPSAIYGRPIVPTFFMSDELNATGVYDNSTKTKTAMLAVDTNRRAIYQRQGGVIGVQTDLTRGIDHMVMTVRETFHNVDAANTANVALGYNLTP